MKLLLDTHTFLWYITALRSLEQSLPWGGSKLAWAD